ncbi:hypothetical protein [Bacillus sp. es.034]|uniref:hypothetical protein n=1 Tax=Bacillus sp. es.034 TaxID=1761763 RepID=UPI00115E76B6|nr:hypothetical protein [Bacillus sp. es.034]
MTTVFINSGINAAEVVIWDDPRFWGVVTYGTQVGGDENLASLATVYVGITFSDTTLRHAVFFSLG